jgi:hypothetical protein
MLTIPPPFLDVPYVAARYPGAPGVESGVEALADGANCQLYAYALLRHSGRAIGDLRSRELWLDRVWTEPVVELAALDLLLFNRTPDPYGARGRLPGRRCGDPSVDAGRTARDLAARGLRPPSRISRLHWGEAAWRAAP